MKIDKYSDVWDRGIYFKLVRKIEKTKTKTNKAIYIYKQRRILSERLALNADGLVI
jgi:hypothetical protein